MRLNSIEISDCPPVKKFRVENLSDLVVIAGPNGVGKTRLITQLLNAFRGNPGNIRLGISPTNPDEKGFIGDGFDLSEPNWRSRVSGLLQQNRRRRDFHSAVLYYESSRSIQNVQPLAFAFEFNDPFEEMVSWDFNLNGLGGRWVDTQHAIFKRIQSQRSSISTRAIQLRNSGKTSMNLDFDDPLNIFKDAFFKLLGPKVLKKADLSSQSIIYEFEGNEYPITSLSSGEREVVTICFDLLLRKPSDCIIFFDEPEVHLHPELLIRLVNTLRSTGERNQFFFLSHSPDLISSSLEDTVIFLTPPKDDESNQAIVVKADDSTSVVLHTLGQSVGVLSLGKKIVLIEGQDSSLDKKTYTELLNNRFPQLVLVSAGGRERIEKFSGIVDTILDKSIWGISFYLYTDRDMPSEGDATGGAVRRLKRYHLENYFLEPEFIARCFRGMEEPTSWLCDPTKILNELREIAARQIGYVTALAVAKTIRAEFGNVSLMPSGSHSMGCDDLVVAFRSATQRETDRFNETMQDELISQMVRDRFIEYKAMAESNADEWKINFPGKPILGKLCGKANIPVGRFKTMYINAAKDVSGGPFSDIVDDFASFATAN